MWRTGWFNRPYGLDHLPHHQCYPPLALLETGYGRVGASCAARLPVSEMSTSFVLPPAFRSSALYALAQLEPVKPRRVCSWGMCGFLWDIPYVCLDSIGFLHSVPKIIHHCRNVYTLHKE